MKIISESNSLKTLEENKGYEINYGNIKKGSNTKVDIIFKGVTFLNYEKSCGCTTPTVVILDEGFKISISYDQNKVGTINQYVDVFVSEEKIEKKIRFNLKGQIL